MNKLTAEEVRLLIAGLSGNRTIREEKYLAALEIALPVLEQQESTTDTYRQIENDGWIEWGEWIEWGGGECPVKKSDWIEARLRNGEEAGGLGCHGEWEHKNLSFDIIAYRVIENDGREG